MKAKVQGGGGKDFEPTPPGTYPARLVGVIDIGLQAQKPYQGTPRDPVNKVVLTYEFLDEFLKDDDGNDMEDKPRHYSELMAFYSPEATRSKIAQRYLALDPGKVHDGDWEQLLATPCMVTLTHSPKPDGGVWENIESISPMREKDAAKAPELVNSAYIFDMDNPNMEVFDRIPNWIKKIITGALDYAGSDLSKLVDSAPPAAEPVPESKDVDEDEVPY